MFTRIREWLNPKPKKEQRAITYEQGLASGLVLEPTDAGIPVSNEKALTISAYYSAVRHIAESIASLPKRVLEKQEDGGKLPVEEHPIHLLVAHEPNGYQTAPVFWEWAIVSALVYGNTYAKLERDNSGRVIALHPLLSPYVQVRWNLQDKYLSYLVAASPYTEEEILRQEEIFHLPGLTLDGLCALNPIEYSRQSMGVSLALEKFAASFFANGCRPSGWLTKDGLLSDKARMNSKESWRRAYQGSGNTGSVPLLEEGLEFHPYEIKADEAQSLESRTFQVSEAARWAKVPLVKLDPTRATWNNLENYNANYIQETLAPWIVKLEAECNRKLFLLSEKGKLTVDFDVKGLLRGNTKERYSAYAQALQNAAWKTINEVREEEGLPPIEGCDEIPTPPTPIIQGQEQGVEPETQEEIEPNDKADKVVT